MLEKAGLLLTVEVRRRCVLIPAKGAQIIPIASVQRPAATEFWFYCNDELSICRVCTCPIFDRKLLVDYVIMKQVIMPQS